MRALALCGAVWACAPDQDPPALAVLDTAPTPGAVWPADAPLRVRLDGWLDPERLDPSQVSLRSGEISLGLSLAYDPVDRSLLVVPPADLRVGVGYTLEVLPGAVQGLQGERLVAGTQLDFLAGPRQGGPPAGPVAFSRLQGLFSRSCGCHGPEPLVWPPLTAEVLLSGQSRREPGRALVVPGRPLESQLVRKLLPGYPGVRGAFMPPEGPPLRPDQVRAVVGWVDGLVR